MHLCSTAPISPTCYNIDSHFFDVYALWQILQSGILPWPVLSSFDKFWQVLSSWRLVAFWRCSSNRKHFGVDAFQRRHSKFSESSKKSKIRWKFAEKNTNPWDFLNMIVKSTNYYVDSYCNFQTFPNVRKNTWKYMFFLGNWNAIFNFLSEFSTKFCFFEDSENLECRLWNAPPPSTFL